MPKRAVETEARLRSLNMKTTEALRAKLEAAAARSGRVLSHEVEMRLEKSIERDEAAGGEHTSALLDYIGACIRLVEASHGGARWDASHEMSVACRSAVEKALSAILSASDTKDKLWFDAAFHLLLTEYTGNNTLKMTGIHDLDESLVSHHTNKPGKETRSAAMLRAGDRAKLRIDKLAAHLSGDLKGDPTGRDNRLTYAQWLEFTG